MQQKSHAEVEMQGIAFWQTSDATVADKVKLYELLVDGDPQKQKMLDELLRWAVCESALDEAYNNTDFSGG